MSDANGDADAKVTRRTWGLGVAAGALALAGGAGWRLREDEAEARTLGAAAPSAAGAPGPLPVPLTLVDGRTLAAADLAGRAVVLNFWAPWCPPCVREMPELDRFSRSAEAKNVLVIGLAIDDQPAVHKFLGEHPVGFPVSVLGYGGLSWVRKLGNDGGSLPFTAVFDRSGKLVQRKMGSTSIAELSGWTRTL